MNEIIKVENLTKTYGGVKVNNNISFNVKKGETIAIVGDNGAGKTTLVSQIAGIIDPTSGNIEYNFNNKGKSPNEAIGMQFQSNSFPRALTTKDIIDFFKKTAGGKIELKKLEKHMKEFNIGKILNKEANSLSGGEKQRLNIVIALLSDPEVIILDEVSTGLSIGVRFRILEYIKSFKDDDRTIIIISHSIDEIELLADRIILLENGAIKDDVSVKKLTKTTTINNYLKKYFLGGKKKC